MYIYNPSVQNNNFGFIPWQAIVGIAQGAALGTAAGVEYSATKKYLKKEKDTQRFLYSQLLSDKEKELAIKEKSLQSEGALKIIQDIGIKKIVIYGVLILIGLSILGLAVYAWAQPKIKIKEVKGE